LTFCSGGSVELSTDQYVDYSWSNGPVTQNNLVSTAGTYSVTVTNANGCVGTSTGVTVVVNPNPTPVITPVGNDLTSNYTMGNQWAVDLSLIPGLQTITPTVNGTYTVTVTDANGCVGTSAGFVVDDLGMDEAELLQHVSISNGQLTTDLEWVLYDASGREISKGKPGTYDLPSGVFFLVTELGNLRFYNQ
jgi:hypothetical protein